MKSQPINVQKWCFVVLIPTAAALRAAKGLKKIGVRCVSSGGIVSFFTMKCLLLSILCRPWTLVYFEKWSGIPINFSHSRSLLEGWLMQHPTEPRGIQIKWKKETDPISVSDAILFDVCDWRAAVVWRSLRLLPKYFSARASSFLRRLNERFYLTALRMRKGRFTLMTLKSGGKCKAERISFS